MTEHSIDRRGFGAERWLLPAGIEETLPAEAEAIERLRRELLDLFSSWGYLLVIPPFIEYLESLLTGTGKDLELKTFKLTDQLTGRLMGVRADMTPQVARIEARHLRSEQPVRLCYLGTVLYALPDGVTRSRSPIQLGAELYGHGGVESDCEILCLMLETLRRAGVGDVHLDLGHVGIFRGLARQADLNQDEEAVLYDALQRKAVTEIDALLDPLKQPASGMIRDLAGLNGGEEILPLAAERLDKASPEVRAALDSLRALAEALRARSSEVPVHFDLAELRGYRYHTGVVFAAFVPGSGQEVARGGRYDNIGRDFGRARPATGFSADLKALMRVRAPEDESRPQQGILAPWSAAPELQALVRRLRDAGERVIYALPGRDVDARSLGCTRKIIERNGRFQVTEADARRPKD
ncbi:MAG TPA: ATP phosphoribosyltransferase regulatory subunit [Gammaproteobacteria bacterium]|nr:ATP phosphoribosyltransferase regulatory subunit [Gammaproteobacteria bacterium]